MLKHSIELGARLYVFFLLNAYGLGKIIGGQFYRKGNLPPEVANQTLGSVNTYDLGWTFMGHSYGYILFIGLSQIIGAWCLLFNRTKFLGIAILIPILLNIIVFDIIFLPTYGALSSATIYLSLLLLVLFLNKEKVIEVLASMTEGRAFFPDQNRKLKYLLFAGGFFLLCFGFDQMMLNLIGF